MKILFSHRYYWPNPSPYGMILRDMAEHFAALGHDVSVFTAAEPNISKVPSGGAVTMKRTWSLRGRGSRGLLMILDAVWYSASLFFHILASDVEIVVGASYPPVIAGWCASLACKLTGKRFVYHVQDVHPEVSMLSGRITGNRFFIGLLRFLDNQTLRRSNRIVTLSSDMAATLQKRVNWLLPITIINNFSAGPSVERKKYPTSVPTSSRRRRVIFAGNHGQFQNLMAISECFANLFEKRKDIELVFMGDGVLRGALERRWRDNDQFVFLQRVASEQAKVEIRAADIGLVSLAKNMYKVSYPSKLLTYVYLGLPVIAFVEQESALAADVKANRLGSVCDVLTAEGLNTALNGALALTPAMLVSPPVSFSKAFALTKWETVILGAN